MQAQHGVNTPLKDPAPCAHSGAMQNVAGQRRVSSPGGKVVPAFRVVIVYEDFRAAGQAKRAYDFLAASLTHEWQVACQMWKFDLLRIPELREQAAVDAVLADLILIACHGDEGLPAEVRAWIEMWLCHKSDAATLVALMDCPPGQEGHAQSVQAYLERVARQAHMEFFTWPQGLAEQQIVVLDRDLDTEAEPLRRVA